MGFCCCFTLSDLFRTQNFDRSTYVSDSMLWYICILICSVPVAVHLTVVFVSRAFGIFLISHTNFIHYTQLHTISYRQMLFVVIIYLVSEPGFGNEVCLNLQDTCKHGGLKLIDTGWCCFYRSFCSSTDNCRVSGLVRFDRNQTSSYKVNATHITFDRIVPKCKVIRAENLYNYVYSQFDFDVFLNYEKTACVTFYPCLY